MPDLATQHRIDRVAASLAGTALWTVAVAWVAFQVQQEGIAPAVLFPLLLGAIRSAVKPRFAVKPACRAGGGRSARPWRGACWS